VGGPDNEADVILIVASDDRLDLFDEVTRIENSLYPPLKSGARVIFKQYGANLPAPRTGYEHFGFRDGISQPGVRGRIEKDVGSYLTGDYLTPRQYSPDMSRTLGQDLVWPGEFVFGSKYFKQDPKDATKEGKKSLDDVDQGAQEFVEDGSFLVFRRLRQDVGAFHQFLHDTAKDPDLLGAQCVGRWSSGIAIINDPEGKKEKSAIAQYESINNDFAFTGDPEGKVCPFTAHIRMVNPRDGDQTHRLLRRGIPYGEPSWSSPTSPYSDKVDRGLLFLSYQTSIVNQFEFLQKKANFSDPENAGVHNKWVIPTGGGYFFAPSLDALHMLANSPKVRGMEVPVSVREWARIWAHAWLEEREGRKEFRETLKKNPTAAVEKFRGKAFAKGAMVLGPKHDKVFDLTGAIYTMPLAKVGPFKDKSFETMSLNELAEIAAKATLRGNPFCVQPNEWKPD
jgi:Dyp-type peroxidase family